LTSRRSSSHALYAAMPPVTPSTIRAMSPILPTPLAQIRHLQADAGCATDP
jgi:hypothetical protein